MIQKLDITKQGKDTPQLGSMEWPLVAETGGRSEGICFSARYTGVLFFVDFDGVNGLKVHARLNKGKKLLHLKADVKGADIILTPK